MNGPVTAPQMWTRRRLWTTAAMATLVQAGLIFWASDWTPVQPRTASASPAFRLAASGRSEWLALTDPTIFASAHPGGFSGPAWLALHSVDYSGDEPNTAPRYLTLAPSQLGETFREYVRTNQPKLLDVAMRSQPALTKLGSVASLPVLSHSTVEAEGALAARGLLHVTPPPSQTNSDVLPASEVQLLVDARGNPISAALLKSSGLKSADQLAVKLARDAQFNADRAALQRKPQDPDAGVISGRLIFRWHTVPAPNPPGGGTNPR